MTVSSWRSQLLHELLCLRVVADPVSHLLNQLPHGLPRFPYQLVTGDRFLFVEMKHLLLENIVGELGFDLPDAVLRQIRLIRFYRPCHHVHMGMVALIMEGCVPTEVLGRDIHSGGDVVAVGAEKISPRPGIVIAQPLRVLSLQGDNVRPHVTCVVLQFRHGLGQLHTIFVTEETMGTQPLRSRPCCDVLHVAIRFLNVTPVFLQRLRDERRGIGLGGMLLVVTILIHLPCVRKVFHQFCDKLFLLSCWRTVILDQLDPLTGGDVPHVAACRVAASALDVRTFDDQPCHPSSSSQDSRTRFSNEMRPLVCFTFRTLSARRRRRSSSLN